MAMATGAAGAPKQWREVAPYVWQDRDSTDRLAADVVDGQVVQIEKAVDDIIAANPDKAAAVADKPQAIGWFVGQVMKATGGKANPAAVNEILKARLGL